MDEKIGARKLPREVLEEKRRQAHRLRKHRITQAKIREIVGIHADTVGRWLRLSLHELKVNRGGRDPGIRMPIRTVGEYLKRWEFTPQKPVKRAYEQNPKAAQHWLD